MKLVQNWRQAWKWDSVRIFGAMAALATAWNQLPIELQQAVPADLRNYIVAFVMVVGILGRLRDQGAGP